MEIEFTRPSANGQVIIPKAIRKEMKITKDDRFLVFGKDDTIVFKRIEKPVIEKSFDELVKPLKKVVKEEKLTRTGLCELIKEIRKKGE